MKFSFKPTLLSWAVLALFIGLTFSCSSDEEKSSHLTTIPKDVNLLVALDLYAIGEKGELSALDETQMYQGGKSMLQFSAPKVATMLDNMIEDPGVTGINFKEKVMIFSPTDEEGEEYVGIAMAVEDKEKFSSFMKDIFSQFRLDFDVEKKGDYSYVESEDVMVMGFDAGRALVLVGQDNDLDNTLQHLMSLKSDAQITANEDYETFTKDQGDISVFFSYAMLKDNPQFARAIDVSNQAYWDNKAIFNLTFEKDEIDLKVTVIPNEEMQQKMEEGFPMNDQLQDPTLLNYFPQQYMAAISCSVQPERYLEIMMEEPTVVDNIRDFEKETGLNVEKISKAISGDMVFSFFDIKAKASSVAERAFGSSDPVGHDYYYEDEDESMTPSLGVILGLKDKAYFEELLNAIPEGELTKEEDYYAYRNRNFEAFLIMDDKRALVTTDIDCINSFRNGGYSPNLSSSDIAASLSGEPIYACGNLRFDDYPESVKSQFEDAGSMQQAILGIWKNMGHSIEVKMYGDMGMEMSIKMQPTDANSFKDLLNMIEDNMAKMGGAFI